MENVTTSQQSFEMNNIFVVAHAFFMTLIIIATLFGNSLVCLAIALNKSLRNSPTTYFILSLTISDLLTAATVMPFDVESMLNDGKWKHGGVLCAVWTSLYLSAVPISILSLLAVSIDRYMTLRDPLGRYKESRFITPRKAVLIICMLWTYCIVFALVPVMGWKQFPNNIRDGYCYFNASYIYTGLSSGLNFILPAFTMCVIYYKIYKIAKDMNILRQVNRTSRARSGRDRRILRRNLKAAKTISVIVCAYFICWVPFSLLSTVMSFCITCYANIPDELYWMLLLMGYLNSSVNPYLYSQHNRKFRDTFRAYLRTIRGWRLGSRDHVHAPLSKRRNHGSIIDSSSSVRLTSFSRTSFEGIPPPNGAAVGRSEPSCLTKRDHK